MFNNDNELENNNTNSQINEQSDRNDRSNEVLPELKLHFLGGVREIGRNATIYEYDGEMILLDCGSSFASPDMTGYKYSLPDFHFIERNLDNVKAIFITHGHEDHIGGLVHLFRRIQKIIPIYSGRFTCEMMIANFTQEKDEFFNELIKHIFVIRENRSINTGPFSVRFVTVTHSIPDSYFLFIKVPNGLVLHTGDWKFDMTPIGKKTNFADIVRNAGNGVDLLVCDSTRANEEGLSETEEVVVSAFEKLFTAYENKRIVAISFSSNVNRVLKLLTMAQKRDRKVFLFGHSMVKNITAAAKSGLVKASNLWKNSDRINSFPPGKVFILCTGTQGEKGSALYRIAHGIHEHFKASSDDVFAFSSNIIPGCEKAVFNCINSLLEQDAIVVHRMLDKAYTNLHVSGHGSAKDINTLFNLVKPLFFVPVHGEYHHMFANKQNAMMYGMPGENVLLGSNGATITFNGKECNVYHSNNFREVLLDEALQVIDARLIESRRRFLMFGALFFVFKYVNNKIVLDKVDNLLTSHFMENNRGNLERFLKEKFVDVNEAVSKEAIHSKLLTLLCSFFRCNESFIPLYRVIII